MVPVGSVVPLKVEGCRWKQQITAAENGPGRRGLWQAASPWLGGRECVGQVTGDMNVGNTGSHIALA